MLDFEDESFFTPIIQGFVKQIRVQDALLYLISRRSYYQGGTRYNSRGCDIWGNASNFVETEQILSFESQLFSYMQIRGSVPFLWKQNSIGILSVGAKMNLNQIIFQKQLHLLKTQYPGKILLLNLLGNRGSEPKLS